MKVISSILAAAVVASGAGLIAGSGSANAQATAPPSAAPSPASTAASPAAIATVDTKDFAFAPATLTIAAGTKVTFKNSDSAAHTVTASDKSFDSGNMDQNATWSHVFATAGTYDYVCAYHAFMKGTIVVK